MDCTCALYLNDISAWRLRRLDVPRLGGSHLPVGPTGRWPPIRLGIRGTGVRHQSVRTFPSNRGNDELNLDVGLDPRFAGAVLVEMEVEVFGANESIRSDVEAPLTGGVA